MSLSPCEPGTLCAGCSKPAAGLAPNLDKAPTCRACEAERLALIELILEAAAPVPTGDQLELL